MIPEQVQLIHECTRASLAAEISFPVIVSRLADIGIERYHADYSRHEITYDHADGDSVVIAAPHASAVIGRKFSPPAIEAEVRRSQRGEQTYPEFVERTMSAGCVGYFVQITGRCVLYFGRQGEIHREQFPAAPQPELLTQP
jgi:uncharacterized protein YbcV (DUF1398 family)